MTIVDDDEHKNLSYCFSFDGAAVSVAFVVVVFVFCLFVFLWCMCVVCDARDGAYQSAKKKAITNNEHNCNNSSI